MSVPPSPLKRTHSPADESEIPNRLAVMRLSQPFVSQLQIHTFRSQTMPHIGPSQYQELLFNTRDFLEGIADYLNFPSRVIGVALTLVQHFFLHNVLKQDIIQDVAIICLFVAVKAEDTVKRLRDILVAAHKLHHKSFNFELIERRRKAIAPLECHVIESVSFDFRFPHAEEYVVKIAKKVKAQEETALLAWCICLDAYVTDVPLAIPVHDIALCCVILAGKLKKDSIFPINAGDYYCEKECVRDALIEMIHLYVNFSGRTELMKVWKFEPQSFKDVEQEMKLPTKKEHYALKHRKMKIEPTAFYRPREPAVSDRGSIRYFYGPENERFTREVELTLEERGKSEFDRSQRGFADPERNRLSEEPFRSR